MTASERVLDVARGQIGAGETPPGSNRTKFGRAYNSDGVAWCAIFLWWVFREAGAPQLIHPRTAYTPTLYDWYRTQGRASSSPRVGSLVFYNWRDKVDRIQHVGIVEAVEPDAIVTIEGNTQSGAAGNQSDGDGVWRRRRARTSDIVGYGHPAYSAATAPPPAPEEDIVASLADLERVVNQAIDRKLGGVVWQTTGGLPNRRGPGGAFLPGGPESETLWGYAMNADGSTFRIEQKLEQLAAAARAGGVSPDQLARELAPLLAPLIAQQLAAGFAAAAQRPAA